MYSLLRTSKLPNGLDDKKKGQESDSIKQHPLNWESRGPCFRLRSLAECLTVQDGRLPTIP